MNHIKEHHIVFALILLAALARGLDHPDNITPIGALALFSGAYLDKRVFWLVPLGALCLGDLANGLYNIIVVIAVYAGFLLLDRCAISNSTSAMRNSWSARVTAV